MAEINYYADHIIRGTLSTTGAVSLGGALTVQSGSINLGSGLGRIQGVDTVSASTDAANKAYVDAHPDGTVTSVGLTSQGDAIAITGTPVTTSGNLGITFQGDATDYINGEGDLVSFPSIPQGTITGGGVASRVAFWSASTILSSDVNLYWDGTNDRLGVGTSTPSVPLHVVGTLRAGAAADYVELTTSGNVVFSDGTSAILATTSGTQTLSIGVGLGGSSWNTISHSFSNEAVWNPGILGAMDAMSLSNIGDLVIKGSVGIGTSSLGTYKLNVDGAIRIGVSGTIQPLLSRDSSTGGLIVSSVGNSGDFIFQGTGGGEKFRIKDTGNVGIGTNSPATQLEIYNDNDQPTTLRLSSTISDGDVVAAIISFENGAGGGGVQGRIENVSTEDDTTVFKFYTDNTSSPSMTLFDSGNTTIAGAATATNFILSSDKTLKDKIKDIKTNHVDVKWKNFELISEPGVKRSGVIAQELEAKHPEFIRTDKDGLKSVAYIDLLITKIAELEARLEKAGL